MNDAHALHNCYEEKGDRDCECPKFPRNFYQHDLHISENTFKGNSTQAVKVSVRMGGEMHCQNFNILFDNLLSPANLSCYPQYAPGIDLSEVQALSQLLNTLANDYYFYLGIQQDIALYPSVAATAVKLYPIHN